RHIVRDRRTMLILFGMPVMMMLLLGFAVRTDVKEVRTVVVTASADHLTRRLVAELAATEHFTLVGTAPTAASAERLIRCQRADMAVVFSPSFAARLAKGEGRVQLITDGADPNMARQYTNY
ncbi:ABC transporter permease, partial [Segatella buccae]